MSKHAKTLRLLDVAHDVLSAVHPMTVRQVYYQLVSGQVIENNVGQYKAVSNALVDARRAGTIPWAWIEDRNRRPRAVSMWDDTADFLANVLPQYRGDVWSSQPGYVEVWLEKDALSGIVGDVTTGYGVTLCVGRGYDGWSSIHLAAQRYLQRQEAGRPVIVLYLGDFDPSGEDMARSLRERLAALDCRPDIRKIALTRELINSYHLPPDHTKATDSRRARFVAEHGDETVELDALPADALVGLLREALFASMDLEALTAVHLRDREDRAYLTNLFEQA